jgi:hypothetical protein
MNENRTPAVPRPTEPWHSPGYQVVETSLEVTMYLSPKR